MHSESYNITDEHYQHYHPQVILKSVKYSDELDNIEEENSQENHKENKKQSRLFRILTVTSAIMFTLIFISALLAFCWFKYYKPQMSSNSRMVNYKYDSNLYSDRVPHMTTELPCPPHNMKLISSLNILSEHQDVLFDRSNNNSTHDRDSVGRIILTNGFFNLTRDDNWRWIDPKATTTYQNFCKSTKEIKSIIIKAKSEKQMILYIVKDYRESNTTERYKGSVCWQIYHAKDLIDMGFNFLSLVINDYRIACKSLPPSEWAADLLLKRIKEEKKVR